ncbi:MAG: hypothetical protein WBR21_11445 [Rouxiella badensis]|uniref:ABC transporter permease n=1 Tax=Rouxiella badensis TaxID=1646377 RepID=UPI003C496E18
MTQSQQTQRWSAGLADLLCLCPSLFLLVQSLALRWDYPFLFPQRISLQAWQAVLGSGQLHQSLLLSITASTVVGCFSTTAGFVTSRYVAWHARRPQLLFLAYVPFVISPVILGTCLLHFFIELGIADTLFGIMAGQVIIAYGFAIVFFVRFWNARIRSMQDLVLTLGGNTWSAFRFVLVPVARGPLLVCFCQTFLISWFDYGLAVIIGGGKIPTLTVRLFGFISEANMPVAAVSALFLITPPTLLFWLTRRLLLDPARLSCSCK